MSSFLDFSELSFLVADDSRFMRRIVVSSLRAFGARDIHEVATGEEAYDLIESGQYDIVLLDWEFPGRSGESIMRTIRRPGHIAAYQTVIMMSGHHERRKIERALKFGVNGYVAKPVAPATLYAQIFNVVRNPRPYLRTQAYLGPEHPLISRALEKRAELASEVLTPAPIVPQQEPSRDDFVELDL